MTDSERAANACFVILLYDYDVREAVQAFEEQFGFLSVFRYWAQRLSRAHEIAPDFVAKVAAAVKEILKELERSCHLVEYPEHWCDVLLCSWVKTPNLVASRTSKVSTVLRSFAGLNEKVELLKQEIGQAYCTTNLSSYSFTTQPPPGDTVKDLRWEFRDQVERNLKVAYEKSDFSDSLKKQMAYLTDSLSSLGSFIWMFRAEGDAFKAHYRAVTILAAHLSSLCWAAKMDQNMKNNVSVLVLDLKRKTDLAASPELLEMLLESFLYYNEKEMEEKHYLSGTRYGNDIKQFFLKNMLRLRVTSVVYEELRLLLDFLIHLELYLLQFRGHTTARYHGEIQRLIHNRKEDYDRFSLDIKDVIREAALFKNREYRTGEIDPTILFAKIWCLKTRVFLVWPVSDITLFPGFFMEKQIQALHKGFKFLKEHIRFPEETTRKKIFTLIEKLSGQIESVHQSSDVEELKANKMRNILHKFLVQVMLLQAKKQLFELLNNNLSLTVTVRCQMGMLHEGLMFVIASDINQQKKIMEEDEKQLLTRIEVLADGVLFLCNSLEADKATEEATDKVSLKLCDLLDMLPIVKAKLREIHLQLPILNFPKTHGLHFVESLLQSLRELLSHKPDSIACVTHQIEAICGDLGSLVSSSGITDVEQRGLYTRLVDAAYLAEYVIDSIIVESIAEWSHLLWLYHASEEIRCIKMEIKNVTDQDQTCNVKVHDVVRTSSPLTSQVTSPSLEGVMVVLKDQEEVIINQVTRGSLERYVVSIAGMAGIGKTTLANKVFRDPRVINHFHVRAWCSVSQEYRKRDLLLRILRQMNKLNDNIVTMADEDLEVMLYKQLKRNRYLIVMDDVWNTGGWDDLQRSFPNDKNGSRILITSRLHSVVLEIQPESDPHHLRLLSGDESWELLEKKAFQGKVVLKNYWKLES